MKCPQHKINISKDREVINCDNLQFPWKQDPNGYFLVKIKDNEINCGFVNHNFYKQKTSKKNINRIKKFVFKNEVKKWMNT
jgi:flavin-dependent dehydrogenase